MSDESSDNLFDKILGKKELKERIENLQSQIEELESENQELENTVEKLRKRKSKEVTEKQRAYEQKNKLEDKITQLEDKIEKLSKEEEQTNREGLETVNLNRKQVEQIVHSLQSVDYEEQRAVTAYITENKIPEDINNIVSDTEKLLKAAPCTVFIDEFGLVSSCLEPIGEHPSKPRWSNGFDFESEFFIPNRKSLFVLIRSDLFGIGLSHESGNLEHLKGFTSNVKSSHSKGGFSQSRFERLRDEQIDNHVKKSEEQIERFNSDEIDRIIVTGQKEIVNKIEEYADFVGYTDASGSPKNALKNSYHDFWSSRLHNL